VWLVSKVLNRHDDEDEYDYPVQRRKGKGKNKKRKARLVARSDEFSSGSGYPAAQLAPPVYHAEAADSDPFPAFESSTPVPTSAYRSQYRAQSQPEPQGSFLWDTVKSFAESDAGKMLIGQVSGVLIALVTRKVNDWMDVNKNDDLAASANEPETKDIDFVIHHDDTHAPNPPA
jgi:hypothetical protein